MPDLIPCKACGAKDSARLVNMGGELWMKCRECGAAAHDSNRGEASAIADWNRRTPSPAVKALVEAFGPLLDLIPRDGPKPEAVRKAQAALAVVEREIGGA